MFVILAYDVNQKRVGKVLKVCRKYLVHVQRSVFEGKITQAQLERLKKEIKKIINTDQDSVCIYHMESVKYMLKEEIGRAVDNSNII